jgi:hypothetical protein
MAKIKTKQINFTVLYGVVEKKKKHSLTINYGAGKIKILMDEIDNFNDVNINYTISVSGYLKQGWIRTYIVAQQISIFDKKPHHIDLES